MATTPQNLARDQTRGKTGRPADRRDLKKGAAAGARFAEVAGFVRKASRKAQTSLYLTRPNRTAAPLRPARSARGTAARQAWARSRHPRVREERRPAYVTKNAVTILAGIFGDHRSPYWKGCSLDTARSGTTGDFGVLAPGNFAQARRFRCARGPFRRRRPGARVGVASTQKIPADPRARPRRSLMRLDGGEFKSDRTRADPQAY